MKPVDQTRLGYGEGNCMMAAVCSVLEVPLEEPDGFWEALRAKDIRTDEEVQAGIQPRWWQLLEEFCLDRAWMPYSLHAFDDRECEPAPRGYSVQNGVNPDGVGHSVVALDGIMAHDPNPSRAGVVRVCSYIVLVPLVVLDMEPRTKGPQPRNDRPWDQEEDAA